MELSSLTARNKSYTEVFMHSDKFAKLSSVNSRKKVAARAKEDRLSAVQHTFSLSCVCSLSGWMEEKRFLRKESNLKVMALTSTSNS